MGIITRDNGRRQITLGDGDVVMMSTLAQDEQGNDQDYSNGLCFIEKQDYDAYSGDDKNGTIKSIDDLQARVNIIFKDKEEVAVLIRVLRTIGKQMPESTEKPKE